MLRRKVMERLQFWKQYKTKQAMLVTGARQIGKTFIIREFATEQYEVFIEFNLISDEAIRESFKAASSAEDLYLRISIAAQAQLVPGKTLIFFDEVQEYPELVTHIKFLVDRGEYDYVLSGSLLGVTLQNIRSYPAGYMTEISMYPLDFEEFCWANGLTQEHIESAKNACLSKERVHDFLHQQMMELFHRYLIIGGMPDAVVSFLRDQSVDQVRVVQDNVIKAYQYDITKYAPKDRRLVIRNIYGLIPSELSSQSKRFRLDSIDGVKRFKQVQDEFLWLANANVALPAYNITAPISPLRINESRRVFKLFMSDVGMLCGCYPKQASLSLLDGKPAANIGATYENYVAQELTAHGFDLRYFTKQKIGEIDFVAEDSAGAIFAIEVKSGNSYKTHAALTNALRIKEYDISDAIVLAETNVEVSGSVTYLPLYATIFLSADS
jgi:predicted AAA+ superfamily ATPase